LVPVSFNHVSYFVPRLDVGPIQSFITPAVFLQMDQGP
jgi:hypothetical protein